MSSGATGYAIAAGGSSTVVKLTQVTGTFIKGEQIIINEDPELSRSITTVRTFWNTRYKISLSGCIFT